MDNDLKKKIKHIPKKGAIRALGDYITKVQKLEEDLELSNLKLANMAALLECICRRHGSQSYTRMQLEGQCKYGKVKVDITENRLTVRLDDDSVSQDLTTQTETNTVEDTTPPLAAG